MRQVLSIGTIPSLKEFAAVDDGVNEFRSRDGKTHLSVQLRPQAVRDLQATVLKLAKKLAKDRKLTRGIVATWLPKASNKRVLREWTSARELFRPDISRRMRLVVLRPQECVPSEKDPELIRIGEALRAHLNTQERPEDPSRRSRCERESPASPTARRRRSRGNWCGCLRRRGSTRRSLR